MFKWVVENFLNNPSMTAQQLREYGGAAYGSVCDELLVYLQKMHESGTLPDVLTEVKAEQAEHKAWILSLDDATREAFTAAERQLRNC